MSNLYQRLNSVMKEVQTVFKNVKVSGYGAGYKGVSHDDVTALLHKPLVEAGIQTNINMVSHELTEGTTSKGGKVYISNVWASIEFINIDEPEQRMTSKAFAMGFDSQDKGPGKAYSMAVKYCLLKTLMLESCDEEEQRMNLRVEHQTLLGTVLGKCQKAANEDAGGWAEFKINKNIEGPETVRALSEDGLKQLNKDLDEFLK